MAGPERGLISISGPGGSGPLMSFELQLSVVLGVGWFVSVNTVMREYIVRFIVRWMHDALMHS